MIGVARKILKEVAKRGEIPLDTALRMNCGRANSHVDQFPLALLLEDDYLGISINSETPRDMERMKELNTAISLHMFNLPKNENGEVHYMGITSRGSAKSENERIFLKAKGALYLDEQRSKFRERVYSFGIGVLVRLIAAGFSAWIRGQINLP